MADATKGNVTLLTHQSLINAATDAGLLVKGPEIDVESWLSIGVYVHHAIVEAAVNDPGIAYILQGRAPTAAGVDSRWVEIDRFTSATTAAVTSEITGVESIGSRVIEVDADPTASFSSGDNIYIQDTGVVADGEWASVAIAVTASDVITLHDGLTKAKDAADTIWSQAEEFYATYSLSEIRWIRMIVQNFDGATGANVHFAAEAVALQSISATP